MTPPQAEELALALLRQGRTVAVRAGGRSMEPGLRQGDVLRVEPFPAGSLRVGEVALVRTPEGRLLAHRVVARRAEGWITSGDAVGRQEGPWPESALLGRVTAVRRWGSWKRLDRSHPREVLLPAAALALGVVGAGAAGSGIAAGAGAALLAWLVALCAHRAARRRDAALLAAALVAWDPATTALLQGAPLLGASPLGACCWALVLPAARRLAAPARALVPALPALAAVVLALQGSAEPLGHLGWLPYLGARVSWPAALLGLAARGALALLLAEGLAQAGRWPRRPGLTRRWCLLGLAAAVLEAWLAR